jgi:uncharacterized protein involved in oxidation of intracellular sulfur
VSKTLFILNHAPYGSEHSYNALRLAGALSKRDGQEIRIFLTGDAAVCAIGGQTVPQGFYNVELMLRAPAHKGAEIGVCGSCMDARGIQESALAKCAKRSSLDQLTDWTLWADKVLVF